MATTAAAAGTPRGGGGGAQPRAPRPKRQTLASQPWTGNARELENIIERSLTLCDVETLTAKDLELEERPFELETAPTDDLDQVLTSVARSQTPLRELENSYIDVVLQSVDGNKARAAKILGVDRTTLYRRKDGT